MRKFGILAVGLIAAALLAGCAATSSDAASSAVSEPIAMADYIATSQYGWFLTGKTDYVIQGKMVSADEYVYNILEGTEYTAKPNGTDVVLKSGADVLWVGKLEKVLTTYTHPDGTALKAEDFVPDVYIDLRTIPSPASNFAFFIPKNVQVIVETAWGDVLTANRPEVEHGDGDYLVCRVGEDGNPDLSDVWVVNGYTFQTTYDNTNNKR